MIKAPLAASLQSTLPQAVLKNPSDIFNYSAKIIRHQMVRRRFPPPLSPQTELEPRPVGQVGLCHSAVIDSPPRIKNNKPTCLRK